MASSFFESPEASPILSKLESIKFDFLDKSGKVKDDIFDSFDSSTLQEWLSSHDIKDVSDNALAEAKKHKQWLFEDIKDYIESSKDSANAFIGKGKEYFEQNAEVIQSAVSGATNKAANKAGDVADQASDATENFKDTAEEVKQHIEENAEAAMNGDEEAIDSAASYAGFTGSEVEEVKETLKDVTDTVGDHTKKAKEYIATNSVGDILSDATEAIKDPKGAVEKAASYAGVTGTQAENIKETLKDATEAIGKKAQDAKDYVANHDAGEIKDQVVNQAKYVKDSVQENIKAAVNGDQDNIIDKAASYLDVTGTKADDIKETVAAVADNLGEKAQQAKDFVADKVASGSDSEHEFIRNIASKFNAYKEKVDEATATKAAGDSLLLDTFHNLLGEFESQLSSVGVSAKTYYKEAKEYANVFLQDLTTRADEDIQKLRSEADKKIKEINSNAEAKAKKSKKNADKIRQDAAEQVKQVTSNLDKNIADLSSKLEKDSGDIIAQLDTILKHAKDTIYKDSSDDNKTKEKKKEPVFSDEVTSPDKWSESRLAKYLKLRGTDPSDHTPSEVLEAVKDIYSDVESTGDFSIFLDAWNDSELKKILKNANKSVKGTREEIIDRVSEVYKETMDSLSEHADVRQKETRQLVDVLKRKSFDSFDSWSTEDLKEYLKSYGAKTSGKHSDLVNAAKDNYYHFVYGYRNDRATGIGALAENVKFRIKDFFNTFNFTHNDL